MLVFRPRGPVTSNPPPDNRTPQQAGGESILAAAEFPAPQLLAGRVVAPSVPSATIAFGRPPTAITLRSEPALPFPGAILEAIGGPFVAGAFVARPRLAITEGPHPADGRAVVVRALALTPAPQVPIRALVAFVEAPRPEPGLAVIYRPVWETDAPPVPPVPPVVEPTAPGGVFRRADTAVVFRRGDTSVVFRRRP